MINDIGIAILQLQTAMRKHGLKPIKKIEVATEEDLRKINDAIYQRDNDVDCSYDEICSVRLGSYD